jgi:hypothetical protein
MEGGGVRNANEVPSRESHQLAYQRMAKDERKQEDCQDKDPSVGPYMTNLNIFNSVQAARGPARRPYCHYFAHESP